MTTIEQETWKPSLTKGKIDMNRRLIAMVEERPCLWDKRHPDYRDKFSKDRAWLDIFKEFEPLYETMKVSAKSQIERTVMKKWYNIRDAYVKSRRLYGFKRKPYIYADQLKFLDGVISNDPNASSFVSIEEKIEPNDIENPIETDNASENWLEDINELSEVYVNIDEHPKPKRAKMEYERNTLENEDNIVAVLANLLQKEEDEDRAFFKSITPSVKKLSEKSKLEFRIQVMKLVKELREQDKRHKTSDDDSDD